MKIEQRMVGLVAKHVFGWVKENEFSSMSNGVLYTYSRWNNGVRNDVWLNVPPEGADRIPSTALRYDIHDARFIALVMDWLLGNHKIVEVRTAYGCTTVRLDDRECGSSDVYNRAICCAALYSVGVNNIS